MFYIVFELQRIVHITATRCMTEMGFESKCSNFKDQVIYLKKSNLNIGDMRLIPLDRVTYSDAHAMGPCYVLKGHGVILDYHGKVIVIHGSKRFRRSMNPVVLPVITLTLLQGWWGRCEKKLSPEGGRKGGWRKKARLPGPGLKPGTCLMLGKGPQGGCLDKQAFPCLQKG